MKRVYLIGDPVGHSISPEMQNAAFQAFGMGWRYELLPTPHQSLAQSVEILRRDECAGANVTIPHKESIIRYLEGLSERAEQIGAVNTIIKRNDRLIGDNTDVEGILKVLNEARIRLESRRVVILGAGGAARAAAFALAQAGVRSITLVNRTQPRAQKLAESVSAYYPNIELQVNQLNSLERADIIVNATCVGMAPKINATPWPQGVAFPKSAVVFDLIYRPRRTRLLAQAEQAGCSTIGGLAMLVHQGAASFRLWTGFDPPFQIMFQAAEQTLADRTLAAPVEIANLRFRK